MFKLPVNKIVFPPVSLANTEGMLAFGGDLSTERLIVAYKNGIFPWFNDGEEILWWAPNPRMVLFPDDIKVSKSMRSLINKKIYRITENTAFSEVINQCAQVKRKGQAGTWLIDEMIKAYIQLYKKGLASSIEVWNNKDELVGGLYGVHIQEGVFSGESMFHLESNTSKLAYIYLAQTAKKKGYKIIDCQLHTPHLESLGAREITRDMFMKYFK